MAQLRDGATRHSEFEDKFELKVRPAAAQMLIPELCRDRVSGMRTRVIAVE